MYKKNPFHKTGITLNKGVEGETLEQKIERIVNNNEPIQDGAPIIYTERKDGVLASYNIRTDRFEIALDATDKIQKSYTARREERGKVIEMEHDNQAPKGESTQDATPK